MKPEWTRSQYSLNERLTRWGAEMRIKDPNTVLRSWLKTHFRKVIGHIDPAISESEKADWWAMATVGITQKCPICNNGAAGHIVILDIVRFREADPEVQANFIGEQFMLWKQDKIQIETVAYQAGLYALTRNIAQRMGINLPIRKWKPDRSKRRRAILQSGMWAGGLVHVRSDMPTAAAFLEEVVQFPQAEHDDMFDAYMGAAEETILTSKRKAFAKKPQGM